MAEDRTGPEEFREDPTVPGNSDEEEARDPEREIKIVFPTPEEVSELGGGVEGESARTAGEAAEADDLESLREKAARADQYFERLQRLQAEFDNYRKRIDRERGEVRQWAVRELIEELVDVVDSYERALHEDHASEVPAPYRKGIEMVHRTLVDTLARYGLTRLEAVGEPFDPHFHEAITQEPNDEFPEGVICGEIKPGYLLGERLLRPSLVRVSAGPGSE